MALIDKIVGYEHRTGGPYQAGESSTVPRMPAPKRKQLTLRLGSADAYYFQSETQQLATTIYIEALNIFYSCGAGAGTRAIYVGILSQAGDEVWAAPRIENASLNGTIVYMAHGIDYINVAAGASTAMYFSCNLPDLLLRGGQALWISCPAMFVGDVALVDVDYLEVVT